MSTAGVRNGGYVKQYIDYATFQDIFSFRKWMAVTNSNCRICHFQLLFVEVYPEKQIYNLSWPLLQLLERRRRRLLSQSTLDYNW
jgi:hypothetical protein